MPVLLQHKILSVSPSQIPTSPRPADAVATQVLQRMVDELPDACERLAYTPDH